MESGSRVASAPLYGVILSAPAGIDALAGRPGSLAYVWVPVMIPLMWATILPALWRLIRVSVFVRRLGSRVRIDLDDPRLLGVFADIGIRHLLVIIIGLSVIPMQAILTGQIANGGFRAGAGRHRTGCADRSITSDVGHSRGGDSGEADRTRSSERTRERVGAGQRPVHAGVVVSATGCRQRRSGPHLQAPRRACCSTS